MNGKKIISKTAIFALVLILIDALWIRTFMYPKYKSWFNQLGVTMQSKYYAIIIAYFVMVLVYPLFIMNNDKERELIKAATIGACIYALYGFTVAAIFPHYGLGLASIETIWGCVLYFICTLLVQKF